MSRADPREKEKREWRQIFNFIYVMRTEKWLIYHKKIWYTLFDYYSIIEWDNLYYIFTMDWKEVDRDLKPIERETFERMSKAFIDNQNISIKM